MIDILKELQKMIELPSYFQATDINGVDDTIYIPNKWAYDNIIKACEEIQKLRKEIEELQNSKSKLLNQLDDLDDSIDQLVEEAKDTIQEIRDTRKKIQPFTEPEPEPEHTTNYLNTTWDL